jgi:hypothetical protein
MDGLDPSGIIILQKGIKWNFPLFIKTLVQASKW